MQGPSAHDFCKFIQTVKYILGTRIYSGKFACCWCRSKSVNISVVSLISVERGNACVTASVKICSLCYDFLVFVKSPSRLTNCGPSSFRCTFFSGSDKEKREISLDLGNRVREGLEECLDLRSVHRNTEYCEEK